VICRKRVRHPSIVPLCEAFTTFAFTQGAANELVFVYPFYDNARVFREVSNTCKFLRTLFGRDLGVFIE